MRLKNMLEEFGRLRLNNNELNQATGVVKNNDLKMDFIGRKKNINALLKQKVELEVS